MAYKVGAHGPTKFHYRDLFRTDIGNAKKSLGMQVVTIRNITTRKIGHILEEFVG